MNRIFTKKSVILKNECVLKKTKKDLRSLFDYLEKKGFEGYPLILEINDKFLRTKYINENKFTNEKREYYLIDVLSDLHNKTSFYKDISKNKYKEIYNKLDENIKYLMEYFWKKMNDIEKHIYFSPSEYLFSRNFSIIIESINYAKRELDTWYDLVENKKKERVVVVHNNLRLEHVLIDEKTYLTNWDKYLVDTPILDLYKFYMNEGSNYEFDELFLKYNNKFKLTEEEIKLFFILISLPKKIEFINNEFINTYNIKKIIDFLYKTKETIKNLESNIHITETSN